jgi:hypothetical protein
MTNRRTLGIVVLTLGVVLLVVGIGLTAYLAGRGVRAVEDTGEAVGDAVESVVGRGEYTDVGEVTVQSIKALAELTTVEMVEYTIVEKGDDRGLLNWATGDHIQMFAVARIGAGVALDQMEEGDVLSDPEGGKVIVRLPAADITYVIVDNEATHVYNRDTGVFTKGDPDLERSARLAAEDLLVSQAHEKGIIDMASERAEDVLRELLSSLGYTDIEVVVARGEPTPDS